MNSGLGGTVSKYGRESSGGFAAPKTFDTKDISRL